MGDIAKNMGEFAHWGFWILEWGILNVHCSYQIPLVVSIRPKFVTVSVISRVAHPVCAITTQIKYTIKLASETAT